MDATHRHPSTASRRPAVVFGVLLVLASIALPAMAQIPGGQPRMRPRSLGPFLVYPLVTLESEHSDNLFASRDERITSTVSAASAGLLLELPLRESSARFGYLARYQDYDAIDIDQQIAHYLDADVALAFSSGAFLEVRGELQDGSYDTRLFDPGGEVTFRPEPFRSWSGEIDVGHEVRGRRLLAIGVRRDELDFDRSEDTPGTFFDIVSDAVVVRGEHALSERLRFLWDGSVEHEDRTRPMDVGTDDRSTDSLTARVGIRWTLGRRDALELLAGWTDRTYERPATTTPYDGVVGRLRWRRSVPAGVRLELGVDRAVYPSAFGDDDFYISDQFRVRVENDLEARIALGASAAAFANDYPTGALARSDDLLEGRVWIGYRFASGVTWEVYAQQRDRASSIDGLDYDELRVGTAIRLGY